MYRKTLKILLVHDEFKDIIQAYIDQSSDFDGEVVDVFYGEEYRGNVRTVTTLTVKDSAKFGGNVEMRFDEENTLIIDAINLWVTTSSLPFVVNGFERTIVRRAKEGNESDVFWMVEVRTK